MLRTAPASYRYIAAYATKYLEHSIDERDSMTNDGSNSQPLVVETIDEPIRFQLHGLIGETPNHNYGEVGLELMNRMWSLVKAAELKTSGVVYWVYLDGDKMFVGTELTDDESAEGLSPLEFELKRYAKHIHVGPYHELPKKWQALKEHLKERGLQFKVPSLEIYGHECEGADKSETRTTILLGLGN